VRRLIVRQAAVLSWAALCGGLLTACDDSAPQTAPAAASFPPAVAAPRKPKLPHCPLNSLGKGGRENFSRAAMSVRLYAEKVPQTYTGIDVCITREIVLVFRVPGDAKFDRRVTALASQWDTGIRLIDVSHSFAELEIINAQVRQRRAQLAAECAPLLGTNLYRHGYVNVRVDGHADRAARVLADLGDGVVVRKTSGLSGNDLDRVRAVGLEPDKGCLKAP
jgi:hypothetical protein